MIINYRFSGLWKDQMDYESLKLNLKNCYKNKSVYNEKKDYYYEIHSRTLGSINSEPLNIKVFGELSKSLNNYLTLLQQEKIYTLNKKLELLSLIIETLNILEKFPFEEQKEKLFILEQDLKQYLDIYDTILDSNFFCIPETYREYPAVKFDENAKTLKKILKYLILRIKLSIQKKARDLRFFIRTIIRFLFKNMDDSSNNDNVSNYATLFINLKLFLNETQRNYKSTKLSLREAQYFY